MVAAELGTGNSNFTGVVYIDDNVLQYLSYADYEKSNQDNKSTTFTIIEKITEFSNSAIGVTMLVLLPTIALAVLALYRKKALQNDIFSGSVSPMHNMFSMKIIDNNKNINFDNHETDSEEDIINNNNNNNNNNKINKGTIRMLNNENESSDAFNENDNDNDNNNKDENKNKNIIDFLSFQEENLKLKIFEPIQNSFRNSFRNFLSVTKVFYEKSKQNDEEETVKTFNKIFNDENENEIDLESDNKNKNNSNSNNNDRNNNRNNNNENFEDENDEKDVWIRKISFSRSIFAGDVENEDCRTINPESNTHYDNENNSEIANYHECETEVEKEKKENDNKNGNSPLLLKI